MTPLLFVTAPELGGKSEDWNPLSKTQKSEMLILNAHLKIRDFLQQQ